MRVPRTILGVTRLDKVNNTTIREALNASALLEEIERNKLRGFGHVMRMDENRKPREYLEWKPDGKNPAGRLRRRWMEGVEVAWRKEVHHCRRCKRAGCMRMGKIGQDF